MENYISAEKAALKWNVSVRQVQRLLKSGRIENAGKIGNSWFIPADASKPSDPRRMKRIDSKHSAHCLPFVFISSVIPMPRENAVSVTEKIENPFLRAQYDAELNYLKGDFKSVKKYFHAATEESPAYISALAEAMVAAVSCSDYAMFSEAKEKLERIKEGKDRDKSLYAEVALATMSVSLFAGEFAPQWLKDGAFNHFSEECKPWAVYLYTKYLQATRQFEAQLAAAKTALAFCSTVNGFTILDIYFPLMCAAACHGLGDKDGAKQWIFKALELALPNGFITPFKETIMTLGGVLEECLDESQSAYCREIVQQPDNLWVNWISFHNILAKET